MPRKPKRHCQSGAQPVTFSRFGRSAAKVVAASTHLRKPSSKFLDNPLEDIPEEKDPRQDSSSDDEAPVVNQEDSSSDNEAASDQDSSSDDEAPEEVVQADFEFFDLKPEDFHGVKTLLQTYLGDKEWDLSGLVDLILAQTTVGTTIKIEDDEDNSIFAVVTALNLGRHKDHKSITEIKRYMLKVCRDATLSGQLKKLVEDQAEGVGLLVSQQVMNLPPQLLPPLYNSLFDEISWATEDEPTEELRKSFRFQNYLMMTRIYKKNTNSKKGSTSANGSGDDLIYVKAEDELFHQISTWSFTFPLETDQPPPPELKNHKLMGLVMAVKAEKIPTFRKQLQALIDES